MDSYKLSDLSKLFSVGNSWFFDIFLWNFTFPTHAKLNLLLFFPIVSLVLFDLIGFTKCAVLLGIVSNEVECMLWKLLEIVIVINDQQFPTRPVCLAFVAEFTIEVCLFFVFHLGYLFLLCILVFTIAYVYNK